MSFGMIVQAERYRGASRSYKMRVSLNICYSTMRTRGVLFALAVLAFAQTVLALNALFTETNTWRYRSAIVHLFEWKWLDIARECEDFLAPRGYAAVQISPPTENLVVWREDGGRPWWERYQVMSYKLISRSGNETEFEEMTRRCNAVGVRIYVDLVINHMTANYPNAVGTGGSVANTYDMDYPAVPYRTHNFHKPQCYLRDYNNAVEVRNCELFGLHDLDHAQPYVRDRIIDLMNHLIDLGVAGFRVDAAKNIWPHELKMMMDDLKPLNTEYGFAANTKPFAYLHVIDNGREAVSYKEYTHIGRICDFRHCNSLSRVFRGDDKLCWLRNWGPEWNLVDGAESVVFVDQHDNQRENDGHGIILNYKKAKQYVMASAFMLAHPHGYPRVMSSFAFEKRDQGPPMTKSGELVSPVFNKKGECTNGYVCEHRWRQIANMIGFRNSAGATPVENWWDNGNNQIAFSRGSKAFIAFNNEDRILDRWLPTGLSAGVYCDVISGGLTPSKYGCTGKWALVNIDGSARIVIRPDDADRVFAIHVGAKTLLPM